MRALLLSAALALPQAAPAPQEPLQHPTEADAELSAAPKAPIAGLAGFRSRSRVVLATQPEQVLQLEAYFVFPERVRWSLIAEGAAATERQLFFRFGESYWSIAPGQASSQPVATGMERPAATSEVHMELRRAAMLWPDGLPWNGEPPLLSARTGLEVEHPFGAGPMPLALFAQLDDAGRPREMSVGVLFDSEVVKTPIALRDITWRQQGQRWWPHTFTLVGYGDAEWRETVESIDTAVQALDSFFVPPDRREELGARPASTPQLVTLPPACERRVPVSGGLSWEAVLEEADRLALAEAQRLQPAGLALAAGRSLELDASGVAVAVLLRLASIPASAPEGWSSLPPREAATARWPGAGRVTERALDRLRAILPAGSRPGRAYVRVVEESSGGWMRQVVLPFERGD